MPNSYIASQIEGRIRLRHIALRNADWAEKLERIFQKKKGVESFTVNTRSGSALLHYAADTLSEKELTKLLNKGQELMDCFAQDVASAEDTANTVPTLVGFVASILPSTTRERRRFLNRSMGIALLISVLSISNERIHAFFAMFFVTLGLNHVWVRRKALQ